jgi:hypothetical protein
MTPDAMTKHVVEICEEHDLYLEWIPGYRGHASHAGEMVLTPRIRSTRTYALALHEIGHCLGRYQKSRSVITIERWAWRWAKSNALI